LAFCDVANWWHAEKVECGCTIANLPLSNGIKTVSILQQLYGEIVRRNFNLQKRNGQTDRQTDRQAKNSTFFAAPAAGEI